MDNYRTSFLTVSELVNEVLSDPEATQREKDMAERLLALTPPSQDKMGRGARE